MQKLNHETSETFKRSGNTDSRVDFDKNSFRGLDIHLEFARFIDRRIEESEETLFK